MAYTDPITRAIGYLIKAADWNQLVNNWLASFISQVAAAGKIPYSTAAGVVAVGDLPMMVGGRLSLETGVYNTLIDKSGIGTVYWVPGGQHGGFMTLSNGTTFVPKLLTELSLAMSGGSASTPVDVFMDYNGGTPQLALLDWTNDTTRATALTTLNGIKVLTGALDWLYLGSGYLDGSKQLTDAVGDRNLWNAYNRVLFKDLTVDSTASWTETSSTPNAVNAGNTAWRHDFMVGLQEDDMNAMCHAYSQSMDSGNYEMAIGLDTSVAFTAPQFSALVGASTDLKPIQASWADSVAPGKHYLQANETQTGGGTSTIFSSSRGGILVMGKR